MSDKNKKELFEFLKENLFIKVEDVGYSNNEYKVYLMLKNPSTGLIEEIDRSMGIEVPRSCSHYSPDGY